MKKGLFLFIAVMLVMLAVGYSISQKGNSSEVTVLKLGHSLNTKHPVHKTMEYMAELVKERSNGQIVIQIFPSEQLGSEKESIEALQLGYLAMTKTSSSAMEAFVPKIRIFGIPYLFRDSQHYWDVLLGDLGKELLDAGSEKNLKGLCYFDAGARSFYTKEELDLPQELKGLKVRVIQSVMAIQTIEAMGGSPTPISWGELYTSLDQGVVDVAENNPPSFVSSRHYEISKYYILDEHTRVPDMLVISTRIWKNLSEEKQRIITEAIDEAVVYNRKLWTESEKASLEKVQAEGVKVIYPDKAPFRQAVQSIWQKYIKLAQRAQKGKPLTEQQKRDVELGMLINEIQKVK